jgi:hypothetical protein
MKQPLILKQPSIQVRLSELPSDDNLINVKAASRGTPDAIERSVIEIWTSRVLGNEESVKWLSGA